jgi:hypothetical protein
METGQGVHTGAAHGKPRHRRDKGEDYCSIAGTMGSRYPHTNDNDDDNNNNNNNNNNSDNDNNAQLRTNTHALRVPTQRRKGKQSTPSSP